MTGGGLVHLLFLPGGGSGLAGVGVWAGCGCSEVLHLSSWVLWFAVLRIKPWNLFKDSGTLRNGEVFFFFFLRK